MIHKKFYIKACVKACLTGLALFFFIFLLLANMGRSFGNFSFFGREFIDPKLGIVMVGSAVCGIFIWKLIKMLFSSAMIIHKYRKEHPIIRPSEQMSAVKDPKEAKKEINQFNKNLTEK